MIEAIVGMTIEKAGELVLDSAVNRISEYKEKKEWEKLFVDTNEFLLKKVERGDVLLEEISTFLTSKEIKQIASNLSQKSKYDLLDKLHDELSKLMMKYEIPKNEANYYISGFITVIFSELEKINPSYYQCAYLGDWRNKEEKSLAEVKEELTRISNAIAGMSRNDIAVYSPEQIEVHLYAGTVSPRLNLDFFEVDDEVFREEFEEALSEELLYIKGQCKEETVFCILNELRKIRTDQLVLVVRSEKDWIKLRKANEENENLGGKILIPWFYSDQVIAIPNNINIFVFGSDECPAGKHAIELRKRKRATVSKKLIEAGMDYESAYRLVEDTHSLYVPMKKKLIRGIDNIFPAWVEAEKNIIIPLMLCGKWTESDGDKMVIEDLCGMSYQDVLQRIQEYTNGENPLFVRFKDHGNYNVHLASTENAWDYLDKYVDINSKLWGKYVAIISAIVTEENPIYNFPLEQQSYANILPGGVSCWSMSLKDGLLRSLVMKAYYNNNPENQRVIDGIITEILSVITTKKQWLSIAKLFPILCEASPRAVTNRLDEEWEKETGLKEVFVDVNDTGIFAKNEYTYFIWSVEQLFCQKEYAAWSIRWLLRMNELRRKYSISNSPYETLSTVFCSWYNNTVLTQKEKILLAKEAFEKGYDVWDLFFSEMPSMKTSVFCSTSKPKYRMTSEPVEFTNRDVWKAFTAYTNLCLDHMEVNVDRWTKMIDHINHFNNEMVTKIVDRLVYEIKYMNDYEKTTIKEAIRGTIHKNRYFNSSDWAMKEPELTILEELLSNINMENPVYEYRYLFKNKYDFPLLHPHPYSEDERREQNEQLVEKEIYSGLSQFREDGLDVIELAEACSEYENSIIGRYIFTVFGNEDFDDALFSQMIINEKIQNIMLDYIQAVYFHSKEDYYEGYQIAKKSGVSREILVRILLIETLDAEKNPLIMNEVEEIKELYWKSFRRGLFIENEKTAHMVIEEMLKYSTHLCIIDVLDDCKKFFVEEELLTILERIKDYEAGNYTQLSDYHVTNILSQLQDKYYSSEECVRVALIELSYRGIIDVGKMRCFNKSLRESPSLYLGMLAAIYKNDKGNRVSDIQLDDKNISSIYSLYSKIRFCPAEEKGIVNAAKLERWVSDFEEGLVKNKQQRLFDTTLGKLFAFSPMGKDGQYPTEEVRNIIEMRYSKSLENGYVTTIYNSRGVYSPTGGDEERKIALRYKENADKIRITAPKTAKIYDHLYESYLYEANSERESDEYAGV